MSDELLMGRSERTEMLLGREATELLSRTRVALFGVGGVGGYALEALVRTGVLNIDIYDSDTVSESNLNRQIIATEKTVGISKCEAARQRATEINSNANIGIYEIFYSPDNKGEVDLTRYDYIIDAIDTLSSKCTLIEEATRLGVKIISSMGTGGKLDPTKIEITDIYKTSVCPLARAVRTQLKKRGVKKLKVVYSREEPIKKYVEDTHGGITLHRAPGSVVFVPAAAGLALAYEVVRDILGKEE